MEEDKNIKMVEGSKMIEDLETEKISGGGKSPNPRLASYYAVLDELNGKTCKFCKKKFVKQAILAEYAGYESKVLRKFEAFGSKAVPCLYCDYWRNVTDFE